MQNYLLPLPTNQCHSLFPVTPTTFRYAALCHTLRSLLRGIALSPSSCLTPLCTIRCLANCSALSTFKINKTFRLVRFSHVPLSPFAHSRFRLSRAGFLPCFAATYYRPDHHYVRLYAAQRMPALFSSFPLLPHSCATIWLSAQLPNNATQYATLSARKRSKR